MVKSSFKSALNLTPYDDTDKIRITVYTVDRGVGGVIDDGDILDDHFPGLWIISAMDEKALILVPKIIAEYTIYAVAFLFKDKLGEIVVVHAC